jgi:HlyD family secretion protein
MLDGVVRHVGADAQEKPEAGAPQAKMLQEAAYRALINLNAASLESQGRKLKLVPGMQVSAEIHLGSRSVIEYLLSPVQKVVHEAGRER